MDSCPMDGRIAKLETDVSRLIKVIEGNGQPGLAQEFTTFVSKWEGREEERDKQAKKSNGLWNLRIAALMAVLACVELAMHGCSAKHVAELLTSQNHATQNAGSDIPIHY